MNLIEKLYQIIKDNEEMNKIIKEAIQEIIELKNKENSKESQTKKNLASENFMKKFTTIN